MARGRTYGLPLEHVREVLRQQVLTPIPGAPPISLGLVNVRGMVVTVLDLGALLAATASEPSTDPEPGSVFGPVSGSTSAGDIRAVSPPSIVLLEHAGRAVGVVVDAVRDVRPLDQPAGPADAEPLPARDVSMHDDQRVVHIDVAALLARVMLSSEEGP